MHAPWYQFNDVFTRPFQIASIFYYLCVVTLQYVAPILMCLYFALMYKTLGGYSWTDLFGNVTANATCPIQSSKESTAIPITVRDDSFDSFDTEEAMSLDKTILDSAKELQSSFHGLKAVSLLLSNSNCVTIVNVEMYVQMQVFTTDVYRGLFGFATWWTCFVWFAATSLGMIYQSYFTKF